MANQTRDDPTPEDNFGRSMRKLRGDLEYTQGYVASWLEKFAGIDLHPSTIAKMENRDAPNPRAIRLNEAAAIASCLDSTIDDMLVGPENAFESAARFSTRAVHDQMASRRNVERVWEELRALQADGTWDATQVSPRIQRAREEIINNLASLERMAREGDEAILAWERYIEEQRGVQGARGEGEADGEHPEA